MSKVFTYDRITECAYLASTDEYEYYGDEFDYEVDDYTLRAAIIDIVADTYFGGNKTATKDFLDDFDLYDTLEEALEDEFKEYFEEEAY